MSDTIRYWWYPSSCRGPYCRTVYELTDSSITFDGYFYEEAEALPQKRILSLLVPDYVDGDTTHLKDKAKYYIEILEKIEREDTSTVGDDGICFFPMNRITLRFRILQKDYDAEMEKKIRDELMEEKKARDMGLTPK